MRAAGNMRKSFGKEIKSRKVVIESTLSVDGEVCARGEVVAVRLPDHLLK